MSKPFRDGAYLEDMLLHSTRAIEMSRGWRREDLNDMSMPAAAAERMIEIVGEAARRVSPEFKTSHPEIAWQKFVSTRYILAHDYGDVNYDTIWRILTVHLPELVHLLKPIVPRPMPDPEPEVD